jgi:hypothetical protein
MRARIYKPAKTAMQSGQANTRQWLLQFEPQGRRQIDSLMGWTGSADTQRQVCLRFETMEKAVAYAEKHGIAYQIEQPRSRRLRIKAYSDNFRYNRP